MISHTDKPIRFHLAEDTIDDRDIDALVAWLKTYPRLTKGPKGNLEAFVHARKP